MLLEEKKIMEEVNEEFDEDNYFSDLEEEYTYMESAQCLNFKEINIIKKFNVYFYFDFNKNKKFVLPINTENFNIADFHIYDLIKYIVKKINNSNIVVKDNNINYSVSLKDIDEEVKKIILIFILIIMKLNLLIFGQKKIVLFILPKIL